MLENKDDRTFMLTMENLEEMIEKKIGEMLLSPEGAKKLAAIIKLHSTEVR